MRLVKNSVAFLQNFFNAKSGTINYPQNESSKILYQSTFSGDSNDKNHQVFFSVEKTRFFAF